MFKLINTTNTFQVEQVRKVDNIYDSNSGNQCDGTFIQNHKTQKEFSKKQYRFLLLQQNHTTNCIRSELHKSFGVNRDQLKIENHNNFKYQKA